MAGIQPSDVLLTVPIYVQALPRIDGNRNRHVLICVRLIRVDDDNVRVETSWNSLECPTSDDIGPTCIHIPRRQGVQCFVPPDPFQSPLYVIITRRNRFGNSYHVGTAIHLHERLAGTVGVTVQHLRVRRRNVLRSTCLRVVRGGDVYSTEQQEGVDACDAEAADETENPDVVE